MSSEDRQILVVPSHLKDWGKALPLINDILRRIQVDVQALEGRNGPIGMLDSLSVDGTVSSTPVVGEWAISTSTSTAGPIGFDVQLLPSDYITRADDKRTFTLEVSGVFKVEAPLLLTLDGSGDGEVALFIDGDEVARTRVAAGAGDVVPVYLGGVGEVTSPGRVWVTLVTGEVVGSTTEWVSKLTISRLT